MIISSSSKKKKYKNFDIDEYEAASSGSFLDYVCFVMELCIRSASLVWNILTLSHYLLLGMLFLKGLPAVETPKQGCVRARSWGRWSTGPYCFHSVCRDKLVVGHRDLRADGGLRNRVLVADWALPSGVTGWKTAENNVGCSLLVSGSLSLFPETGIWSAGQCSGLVLHLGKCRSASCWLQWGSGSRTSRGLAQIIFLSLRSYLGSIFCNCRIGLQTLIIYMKLLVDVFSS